MGAIATDIERRVIHRFTVDDGKGNVYTDALNFDQAAYDAMDKTEIAALEDVKQARFDNWLAAVNAPPPELTKEQLQTAKDNLVTDVAEKQAEIADLTAALTAAP